MTTTLSDFAGLSGLESLRAMLAGRFPQPPMALTMGLALIEVEEGRAVFEAEASERVLNVFGVAHGGFALTLIDSCCGCAGHTTLPAGVGYTTIETKVNFVRAVTPASGALRAEGRVVAQGRTIITAEGTLKDSAGKLYAHGTSTLLVLRQERAS